MALAPKGIDVRQSGSTVVFRVSLKDSSGNDVTTGTTTLYLFELQSDGTLKSYDFADNTFKTTALTTATLALTHRTGNNGTFSTGVWSASLGTVSGFTRGGVYIIKVNNSSSSPVNQERQFQYGDGEGDLSVASAGGVTPAPASIDFSTYSAALRTMLLRDRLTSTGTTSPVTADTYAVAGTYQGGPYYQSTTLGTAIYGWTDGTVWYLTTTAPGVTLPAAYHKTANGATVQGPYTAQGSATGTPVVAAKGNAILSGFQPEQTLLPNLAYIRDLLNGLSTLNQRFAGTVSSVSSPTVLTVSLSPGFTPAADMVLTTGNSEAVTGVVNGQQQIIASVDNTNLGSSGLSVVTLQDKFTSAPVGGEPVFFSIPLQVVADVQAGLTSQGVTTARAAALQNLVGASTLTSILNAVNAITTNTARGKLVLPYWIVRPASATLTYEIDLNIYSLTGQLEAPTAAPTIHARDASGNSLDANLSSTTMTVVSTGKYKITYTCSSTDTAGEVIFDAAWAVGGVNFAVSDATEVQDATTIATLLAVKAKTDLLGTNAADSPNTVTAQTNTTTMLNKWSGITLLANWFRAFGRKSAADATALSEINTGGGTYDATLDSQQAIRDRGDVAWITGAGAGVGGGNAGNGDIPVDHNTGGSDNLRAEVRGSGVAGVIVRAYLQSDWDAAPRAYNVQAIVTTNSDGRWSQPMMLVAGTYTITFEGGAIAWPVTSNLVVR